VKALRTGTLTPPFMQPRLTGPERGDYIFVNGAGDCIVRDSKIRIDAANKFISYKITAITDKGESVVANFPAEVLLHTGFSWANTQIPFELSLKEHRGCFHIIDLDSQEAFDIVLNEGATPGMALGKLRTLHKISSTVAIHRVYSFTLQPSAQRWIASVRRAIRQGTHCEGPLRDCFTHPSATITALAPLKRVNTIPKLVEMQMDLESVFQKHMPEGIKWPALSEGALYDTETMTPLKVEVGEVCEI
jgi:hypothetical protein